MRVFAWLGVTYYLSRRTFFETLENVMMHAARGSTLVFDHLDAKALTSDAPRMARRREAAAMAGEPMRFGIDPLDLEAELEQRGLRLEESLTPAEIQRRYFAGRAGAYSALEHLHLARVVGTGRLTTGNGAVDGD